MKLRHLILLTSAIGACGSLLLAADIYRRLKEAEAAAAIAGSAARDDSVLTFGMYHTMGLLSLAFFFLSLFLMLLSSLRDKQYVAAIENMPAVPAPRAVVTEIPAIVAISPAEPTSVAVTLTPTLTVPTTISVTIPAPESAAATPVAPTEPAPPVSESAVVAPLAATESRVEPALAIPAASSEPAPPTPPEESRRAAPVVPEELAPPASEPAPGEKRVLAFESPIEEPKSTPPLSSEEKTIG